MFAADPRSCALFLDIDGTIVDIAPTPAEARAPQDLAAILDVLAGRFGGALAILTGRQVEVADRLLAPLHLPMAGVHGAELRLARDGPVETGAKPFPRALLGRIDAFVRSTPGAELENKRTAVSVHYRQAPHLGPFIEAELRRVVGDNSAVSVRRGRKVCEIAPAAWTKATAMEAFLEQPQFAGRRPVMVGDDAPDDVALAHVAAVGGVGLRVLGEYFPRDVADFEGPAAVRAWLRALAS